ncbi:MAG: sulfur oxidation c-type cytochrome SoxA [Pseudomonadota bacterium]
MRAKMLWTIAAGAAGLAASVAAFSQAIPTWESRALPEAQGRVEMVDGKPRQVRYKEAPFSGVQPDFSEWRTYRYDDARPAPPVTKGVMPANVKGDPKEGRRLYLSRAIGPCTGCHLIRGDDVWPAGNVGPDHQDFGERGLPDDEVFQMIYDIRQFNPDTVMPPWGTNGLLKPEQIVHIVAFLKTERGPLPPEKDPARDPNTRPQPVGFGDNLDPTNNPAVILAEQAMADWAKAGPKGKSCASCHEATPAKSMQGVATRYPRHVAEYGRVMAIEDFLQMHAPATTGAAMPSESNDNLNMSILVKMQSNGMPVSLDLASPEMKAALERGKATFEKKVGQRNHACADCHTKAAGANKFLGGRLLADVDDGITNHFPLWRTNFSKVWDARKRYQWCMLPLGMNYLASDSIEYAELDLYLTMFGQGKPLNVPGIRH